MKLSNLVLVFGILVIAFSLKWGMKNKLLQKAAYTRFCYNQLTDSALEDGLDAGTADDSSAFPYVEEEKAVKAFKESLLKGFDLTADSPEGKHLLSCIACIVIMQNQYFSVITEEGTAHYPYRTSYEDWNIDFYLDGMLVCENLKSQGQYKGTEAEVRKMLDLPAPDLTEGISFWKNQVVTGCIEEKVKEILQGKSQYKTEYEIDFPDMEEEACHTLQGISMLGFMQYRRYEISGYASNRFTLSGARLVYTD